MAPRITSIDALTVADLDRHPVWEFVNDDSDDFAIRCVDKLPVTDLARRLVAADLRLSSGKVVRGLLGNIALRDRRMTQHFLTLSVAQNGAWFHLARYHDLDYSAHGPEALAQFLGYHRHEIFPIAYDIRSVVDGDSDVCVGMITEEPSERLSRAALVALAI